MDQPPPTASPTTPTQDSTELALNSSAQPSETTPEKLQTALPRTTRSWSLSAIGTFEKCQLKARYRYVDRIEDKRSISASRGVGIHKVIEDFLLGGAPLSPELEYYRPWFEEIRKHEIYPERKISLRGDWNTTSWGAPDSWLRSVLDLLVIRREEERSDQADVSSSAPAKEAIIYDWKTGKVYPDHDDQKSLYSLAVFSEYPSLRQVRAIHVYVDLRQIREKTFSSGQVHELRTTWNDRAGKFLKAVESPEEMIPNPGFHCRWCSYSKMNGGPCRF